MAPKPGFYAGACFKASSLSDAFDVAYLFLCCLALQ